MGLELWYTLQVGGEKPLFKYSKTAEHQQIRKILSKKATQSREKYAISSLSNADQPQSPISLKIKAAKKSFSSSYCSSLPFPSLPPSLSFFPLSLSLSLLCIPE